MNALFKLLRLPLVLGGVACGPLHKADYLVSEAMAVKGQVLLGADLASSNLQFALVDTNSGQRNVITDQVTLTESTAGAVDFSLSLSLQRMNPLGIEPLGERIAAMGLALDVRRVLGGRLTFERRPLGFYRLEVYGPSQYVTKGNKFYRTFILPVLKSHAAGGADAWEVSAGQNISLQQAGTVKVIVKNESGQGIQSAQVVAWSEDGFEQDSQGKKLWPQWFRGGVRPVVATTGSDGSAVMFPVTEGTTAKKYAIAAWAPGFCTAVTDEQLYSPLITANDTVVTLKTCVDANQTSDSATAAQWLAEWKGTTGPITGEAADRTFLFTNGSQAVVKMAALNIGLRPVKVRIFEGTTLTSEPRSVSDFDTWRSALTLDIPTSFTLPGGQKSENGIFTVEMRPVGDDGASPVLLYGSRSTTRPVVDASVAGTYTVLSATGVEGVVSCNETAALTFQVKSNQCQDGAQMGVLLGEFNSNYTGIKYAECYNNAAQFNVTDVITAATGTSGGVKKLKIFLKDKYGNTSENSSTSLNWMDVYADYGVPDLSLQAVPFQSRMGLAATGASKGTDVAPYVFGNVSVSAATAGTFVLRFAAPGECKHDTPSGADGTGPLGVKLARFGVVAPGGAETWAACGEDIPLGAEHFTVAAGAATLAVRVQDAAGHLSQPYSYDIPACPATPACWQ